MEIVIHPFFGMVFHAGVQEEKSQMRRLSGSRDASTDKRRGKSPFRPKAGLRGRLLLQS